MAEGEYVLYFTNATHLYLMDRKKCAAFSTWVSWNALEEETEKLLAYWELHPERKPDAIYIGKDFAYDEALLELLNPEHFPVTEKEYGYTMIREKKIKERKP